MILDLIALDNSSQVWVYQADRLLSYDELDDIREALFPFLDQWTSHQQNLYTYGNVFHRRFIALFVDGSASTGASGCSIDSSVKFITQLGNKLGVDFFDRMSFCYFDNNEEIHKVNKASFKKLYQSGQINDQTLVFDHLVKTKGDFLEKWTVPLGESWLLRMAK